MKLHEFSLTELKTLHEALVRYVCRDEIRTNEQAEHETSLLMRLVDKIYAVEQELLNDKEERK